MLASNGDSSAHGLHVDDVGDGDVEGNDDDDAAADGDDEAEEHSHLGRCSNTL